MKLKSTLLIFFILFLAMNSCKDVEEPNLPILGDPKEPDTTVTETLPTSPVKIEFPEGTSVNLDDLKILSGFFENDVSPTGTTKSFAPNDEYVLAYILDKEDRAMLMGFLGKGRNEISVNSTAEALIYLGAGIFSLPDEMKDKYFQESGSLSEIEELIKKLEASIKQNPIALNEGLLNEAWKSALEKITADRDVVDVRARVINVDAAVKSGLQIFEEDFENIKVRNSFKRRSHAFLYKQSFTDRDKKETILLKNSDYNGSLKAKNDLEVGQVESLDGVFGTVRNVVTLQGGKYFESYSDPLKTPLESDEIQAVYNLRIVGPGFNPYIFAMTDAEEAKVFKLNLETAILDVILPGIAKAVGMLSEYDEADLKELYDFVESRVSNVPQFYELSKNGDIITFSEEVFKLIMEDLLDKGITKLLVKVAQKRFEKKTGLKFGDNSVQAEAFGGKITKALRYIKIVDAITTPINSGLIINDLRKSTQLESFRVEVNDLPFRIEPRNSTVSVNEQKELKITKLGQLPIDRSYWIKWRTSGKYGVLRDKEGRAGNEIETNFTDMFFRAISNPSQVDYNAEDMVYAEVFIKEGEKLTSIGLDSVKVKVKPIKLRITPDGVTLSPKNAGASEVKLYVETTIGEKLANSQEFEYRYEWGVRGNYGLLNGNSVVENTENNVVRYVAFDEDVEKAEEEVFVKVYRLEKGTTEEILFGEAKGKVKIENDPKKIIHHIPLTVKTWPCPSAAYPGFMYIGTSATFPDHEDAVRYSFRIIGLKFTQGKSGSWNKGAENPYRGLCGTSGSGFLGEPFEIMYGWASGDPSRGLDVGAVSAYHASYGGYAEITVYLK